MRPPHRRGALHRELENTLLWGMERRPGAEPPRRGPEHPEVSCPRLGHQGNGNVGASAGSLAPESSATCFAEATSGPRPQAAPATTRRLSLSPLALQPVRTRGSAASQLHPSPVLQMLTPLHACKHTAAQRGRHTARPPVTSQATTSEVTSLSGHSAAH